MPNLKDILYRMITYDIIVIGAGLGGLTAGAKVAKEGKKVLLLEQHDRGRKPYLLLKKFCPANNINRLRME